MWNPVVRTVRQRKKTRHHAREKWPQHSTLGWPGVKGQAPSYTHPGSWKQGWSPSTGIQKSLTRISEMVDHSTQSRPSHSSLAIGSLR